MSNPKLIFKLLQFATVCVFFGRGWQHLFWDAPYRDLLWDANWMQGIIESLTSMSWQEYVTNTEVDYVINTVIRWTGGLYILCGLIALFIKRLPRFFQFVLLFGAFNLLFLAFLYSKEKFFHLGQFLEYSLQFSTPIFLYLYVNKFIGTQKLILWMKIAIAFTFTCHGLYAIGYYPIPESFHYMNMQILGLNQNQSFLFLKTAGIMDFIISFLIFLPNSVAIPALIYATFWGLATAMARIWANFHTDFWLETLHQWTHESLLRFPHFIIPILVFVLLKNQMASTSARVTNS